MGLGWISLFTLVHVHSFDQVAVKKIGPAIALTSKLVDDFSQMATSRGTDKTLKADNLSSSRFTPMYRDKNALGRGSRTVREGELNR